MRFALSEEQRAFGDALDALLTAADVPRVTRRWADGDPAGGLRLWARLAELGVTGLGIPEEHGGLGGTPLDVAVALERLGYHGVPGPWIETVALAPALLADADPTVLPELAKGTARITCAAPPWAPYALDTDTATHVYLLTDETLARARAGDPLRSVDPARRLSALTPVENLGRVDGRAVDAVTLGAAAWLVGAGQRLLDDTVTYVGTRRQFGRVVGEYQAVKHALADVLVGLDFARPLVHGAARALAAGHGSAEASGAKVLASDAAHRAARTALQLHGAIGYTREFDLSLWLLRVRALVGAWGTPAFHRARVATALRGA
ncbi:acyl-CoA dehydrogenase family protein [Cryptosporangium arvum]|uniref:Acyl-CoA dehydrogenase n=1 Tax=Cryptosporangium arvum DSM 44712 TaxID=927661 RepID=A0A010ZYW8_9ACTN|nr:acyl-CoA dehydrogenase family protein [Cryptosporangium arvum]EXG82407.1 acyl-CoA dehydrogenase [Cryptosporangium arvum DSM 44712]